MSCWTTPSPAARSVSATRPAIFAVWPWVVAYAMRTSGMSDRLRDHLDGAGRALLCADPAALAEVEVDLVGVRARGVELDDRVVGTDAEAVVAGEARPARHAAARLEQRALGVQAADHLVEGRGAARGLQPRAHRLRRVGVVPGVQ